MVEDLDLLSAFRSMRDRRLRVGDWLKSLRGIHEAACFAWDDPLPFLMMGVTDCCEFYQWMRRKQSLRQEFRETRRNPPPSNWPLRIALNAGGSRLRMFDLQLRRVITPADVGEVHSWFRPVHLELR